MKAHGLNIDIEAIAEGLYDIIEQKGEQAIVAFGMIPKWAIDCLGAQLTQKVKDLARAQMLPGELEIHEFGYLTFDEKKIKSIVADVSHQIVLGIYAAAQKKGALLV